MFTAAEIATAIGKTKRGVQLILEKIKPNGSKLVRGQQADAWLLSSLPCRYLQELDSIAERRGYKNAEHLLSDLPRRFVPMDTKGNPVKIGDIADNHVQRAAKRREALALSLSLRDRLTEGDSKILALASFRGVLGNAREETWNRWLKRVIQRDAGAERFEDLTLYFEDVVCRKPEAREQIAIGSTAAERTLLNELALPRNLAKPTLAEKAKIWEATVHFVDDAMARGGKQKHAIRRAVELIAGSRVCLASNVYRLRRNIKEKFLCWLAGGRTFAALEDKRPANSGPKPGTLSEKDELLLIAHIAKHCGGRGSQGYRELRNSGSLSPGLTSRYIGNPKSKSYVPALIRRQITPKIDSLKAYHHGPREHRLRGAYQTRDWSGMAAGDWFQSDDLTAPVHFWKQGIDGVELTRGQFLPMIDERTGMILGFVLIQEKNYNSISIRSLITNVCAEHGLPRRGFAFERGIWKTSRTISGRNDAELDEIADTGLRRLGMTMRHALLPRAKVIERSLGQLQDLMEGLPGYCGRSEQTEKFEALNRVCLDVNAGRADAREHFLSAEQTRNRFADLCDIYNNDPQEGRLNGLSPTEGWEQLQGTEPRTRFDPRLHYFLASDLRRLKIGRNGLTIQVGKQRFNYKGEETGRRVGETVLAWWNPDCPDLLTCTTDLNGNGIFTVERSYELPAWDAERIAPGLLAEENRKVEAHNRCARDLYHVAVNSLPPSVFRGQLVAPPVVRLGEEMAAQQGRKRKERAAISLLGDKRRRVAQAGGIHPATIRLDPEAIASAEKLNAIKARVEKRLAAEEGSEAVGVGPSGSKTYVLDAPAKPLSVQQRVGMYWRLWKAAEKAQPGINRFAVTTRALGQVKKIADMSEEEFLRICRVFESIAKKGSKQS